MLVGDVRCAMSSSAVFLEVVRDQPVIGGGEQIVEEAPRLARDLAKRRRARHRPAAARSRGVGRPVTYTISGREQPTARSNGKASARRAGAIDRDQHARRRRQSQEPRPCCAAPAGASASCPEAIGGDPFEHRSARDEQAPQRPADRIEHHPALMREERPLTSNACCALWQGCRVRRQVCRASGTPRARLDSDASHLHVGGKGKDQKREPRPEQRRSQEAPSIRRRAARAAPAAAGCAAGCRGSSIAQSPGACWAHAGAARVRHRPPDPADDLPVAADPAMLPRGKRQIRATGSRRSDGCRCTGPPARRSLRTDRD